MQNIPITRVLFDEAEIEAVQEPLRSGWIVQGPYVAEFERKFADFAGSKHAIATTSCTTALHLSLAAAGIGPGDEVIVPAFTWVATANVVEYMGAKPVFCDIDLETFNVDVDLLPDLITDRTRAIIPVHLFGLPADMYAIRRLARWHDLVVVEDAACGFGATYEGTHVGTLSHFGCFSFHPRKAITTGEGGMILTQRDDAAELCRTLRDHGASKTDLSRHAGSGGFLLPAYDHLGYNYRMTDLQGAIGSMQMDKAGEIQSARVHRAERYDDLLESTSWLRTPTVPEGSTHAYQSYVCLFRPEPVSTKNVDRLHQRRNALMAELESRGIATRQGTHAVTSQGYYRRKYGIHPEAYPQALLAERLSLTLPVYPQMTDEEQDYVVAQLHQVFESYRRAA
ncbi:MAG: DegT/DnrJ/EryC1/StrS family aminotransferase [Rhodothermales bacterium]